MCGRFVRDSSINEIAKEFGAEGADIPIGPSYNVAPTQDIVIVVNDGRKRLVSCRWGFLPAWAKDERLAYKMINARAETVAEKPSYREAFREHRCLVVANGFYEWKKEGDVKRPYYISLRSGRPFGFAGVFNVRSSPGGGACSSAIITTGSNEVISHIHDRMPVIIANDKRDKWLDPDTKDKDELLAILSSGTDDQIVSYEVSTRVNYPANDSRDNIIPIEEAT